MVLPGRGPTDGFIHAAQTESPRARTILIARLGLEHRAFPGVDRIELAERIREWKRDPESPVDDESVATTTAAIMRRNPETPVVVKGDEAVDFGRVAYALALLQRAGAPGVGILTDPVDVEAN